VNTALAIRLGTTLSVIVLVALPQPASVDPARTFLMTAFKVSPGEIARLDRGDVVSRTLDVENRREVATLGIVRIEAPPSAYVERLIDITGFKRSEDVLQIGKFSDPPEQRDLASLVIDEPDLKALRECRVDDCDIRLSAADIERVRSDIDWHAPDAARKASVLLRQLLTDYARRYRHDGAGAMEYADRVPRLNVAHAFASLLDADTITANYAPRLRSHLLEYPAPSSDNITDFLYWSKERVHSRGVISITHVAISGAGAGSPIADAIGSKQIYAAHYFDASLGLTLLVPDRTAPSPATYVVYLNRSRIDLFGGLFGGVVRRIVAGKAKGVVAEQLERLRRLLGAGRSRPPGSHAR
jgi:hypothetical protein